MICLNSRNMSGNFLTPSGSENDPGQVADLVSVLMERTDKKECDCVSPEKTHSDGGARKMWEVHVSAPN